MYKTIKMVYQQNDWISIKKSEIFLATFCYIFICKKEIIWWNN